MYLESVTYTSKRILLFMFQIFLQVEESIEEYVCHAACFEVTQADLSLQLGRYHIQHLKEDHNTVAIVMAQED